MESCADAAQNSFVWGSYGEHKRQKANAKLAFKYMLCLVLAPLSLTETKEAQVAKCDVG